MEYPVTMTTHVPDGTPEEEVDADRPEEVLGSMPPRFWRSDEVTELSPPPNDPGPGTGL